MQAANFARLQKHLRSNAVTGVTLVSITTDPANDTPAHLKEWAEKFGRRPGWLLLTGRPEEVEPLLVALTGDKGGPGLHSAVALVTNASTGEWIRADALESPQKLAAMIDNVRTSKPPKQLRSD
jgi:protein SCO1/2